MLLCSKWTGRVTEDNKADTSKTQLEMYVF